MREYEKGDLELEINRYLDGDISDEEFESILKDRPESIDLARLRAFRSRIERIEELYRQIDEPVVPDGYWENFADRIAQRLPSATHVPLTDRILGLILPWRWPATAYSYVGAVASVLLIFFIGKTVQEAGKDVYAPLPAESISEKSPIEEPDDWAEQMRPAAEVSEPANDIGEESPVDAALSEVMEVQGSGRISKDVPAAPDQAVDVSVQRKKPAGSDVEMPARSRSEGGGEEQELEMLSFPSTEEHDLEIAVDISKPAKGLKQAETVFEDEVLPDVQIDPERIGTQPEEEVVIPVDKGRRAKGERPSISLVTGNVGYREDADHVLWPYDDVDSNELRENVELIEADLTDLSYTGHGYLEYVKMKSVLALRTRDTTDIREAMAVMDTLLKYNPSIDKELWLKRRSAIQAVTPSSAKP